MITKIVIPIKNFSKIDLPYTHKDMPFMTVYIRAIPSPVEAQVVLFAEDEEEIKPMSAFYDAVIKPIIEPHIEGLKMAFNEVEKIILKEVVVEDEREEDSNGNNS